MVGPVYKSGDALRADYWVVNPIDQALEVYRTPVPTPGASFGWAFREVQRLRSRESISPLVFPHDVMVAVADLLP